jgi:hypothetical protein
MKDEPAALVPACFLALAAGAALGAAVTLLTRRRSQPKLDLADDLAEEAADLARDLRRDAARCLDDARLRAELWAAKAKQLINEKTVQGASALDRARNAS